MSRVIVKVNYHNPGSQGKSAAGYAEYMATREGVEIREQNKTYADYIATRPGVEFRGDHGLFTIENRPVDLNVVSDELNKHKGHVWTVIVSLTRDDATKTGYDNSEAWRKLINKTSIDIANNFNLPINEMNCYAAYHDAKDHPHIHMIVYSKDPSTYSGFHKASSLQNLKSIFTNSIFEEELSGIYKLKDESRNQLRQEGSSQIKKLAEDVNANNNVSPELKAAFIKLSKELSTYQGRKSYGYLSKDMKALVDDVIKAIASDPKISELYELWYEEKQKLNNMYNSKPINKVSLENNKEFTMLKNAVIKEAANVSQTDKEDSIPLALNDLFCLLSHAFVQKANDMELDNAQVIEHQDELDEALGIRHE